MLMMKYHLENPLHSKSFVLILAVAYSVKYLLLAMERVVDFVEGIPAAWKKEYVIIVNVWKYRILRNGRV
jgi:hypothetical protein